MFVRSIKVYPILQGDRRLPYSLKMKQQELAVHTVQANHQPGAI
ncbi:MAG: hypothetical protein JWM95_1915, partial [Gemmatimonadetes bacterium]|nr:hypothetical protein [Gemmatimonadota bacterium]